MEKPQKWPKFMDRNDSSINPIVIGVIVLSFLSWRMIVLPFFLYSPQLPDTPTWKKKHFIWMCAELGPYVHLTFCKIWLYKTPGGGRKVLPACQSRGRWRLKGSNLFRRRENCRGRCCKAHRLHWHALRSGIERKGKNVMQGALEPVKWITEYWKSHINRVCGSGW